MTNSRIRVLILVGVALVATGANGSAVTADPAPRAQTAARSVTVNDDYFRARTVSIRAGGSVTWRWRGGSGHDVRFTSGRRRPRGCRIQRRGTCTRRFSRRGAYRYVCTLHDGMTGRVNVR